MIARGVAPPMADRVLKGHMADRSHLRRLTAPLLLFEDAAGLGA